MAGIIFLQGDFFIFSIFFNFFNLFNKRIFNKNNIILSVSSVVFGMLNGFAGTGGGIILYFTLKFLRKRGNNQDTGMKDIMATVISAVIPMSVISSAVYMIKDKIIYRELWVYLPAALAGGIAGALLLDKLKFKIVKKIFAGMIIYAGIRMILN